ncbi:flagellar hook-associated protein FlgK [Agarilytica rhodophyticola]|uniref:flagellar hook-associated protein FlgK n=1 Tax=Agarilytica rhodophyticola TaxID=1737490 RepID=UPI000B346496|nr:flagellar hook-associated protein FlgK [Agarilytica rhodophyticola]
MTSQLLGVSVTGLRVAQSNLSITGHNIASADVEGYSRQIVNSETNNATPIGNSFIGNGVNVASIERVANQFIIEQMRVDTSLFKDLDIYNENISQLDRLLSDPATGLSGGLETFFAALQNGADDPTSIPARQLILSESENLADRFNTIYDRLEVINDSVDDFINSAVSQINSLVDNIVQLNLRIADAQGVDDAQPNDLLDQRDEAIRQLSELVAVQTYDQGAGQVNVVLNSGQNLVIGTEARHINVVASASNSQRLDVAFENGANDIIITDLISGGELGGLLRFQNTVMDQAYNELGRIAIVMADTFNELHQQGINLNNEFGGNFFYDVNETTIARNRVIGNSNNNLPNDRVLSLNIADSSRITADDYEVTIEAGGLFRVTNLGTGEEVISNVLTGATPQTVEFDGFELVFERGSFQVGDSYTLLPSRSASRDFSAKLLDASSIAFGSPLVTDASIGNVGNGDINFGEVLSLDDVNGNSLPLFATPGEMNPPLMVRFTTANTYEILDNSNPGNPVDLNPPIRNQRYIPGISNNLFPSDPGETAVQTNGSSIGLPLGRLPVVGGGALTNGYPAEAITITQASSQPGVPDTSLNVFTSINASARETASLLNNVEGVSATASNYMEITDVQNLSLTSPLQINLNGEDLIEYEFDAGSGTFILDPDVPDPTLSADQFNDYLEDRINNNANLSARGIYAVAGIDATTGVSELRIYSTEGDDFQISLEADAGGPDSLSVGDGSNPTVALDGNGAGVTSAIAIGGSLDVRLSDGISLETFPPNSLLFGDTQLPGFATSTYLGIQASIQGTPQAGDTFTLDFNSNAASDNRNALALAGLQNQGNFDNGTASYSDAYSSLVEAIGIDTASSRVNRDASEQVLQETTRLRDSVSAVNLDEEAANLIKYEQMFSANAQVISVARELFDQLLNSL